MDPIEQAWQALEQAARQDAGRRIVEHFAAEPGRLEAMTLEACDHGCLERSR